MTPPLPRPPFSHRCRYANFFSFFPVGFENNSSSQDHGVPISSRLHLLRGEARGGSSFLARLFHHRHELRFVLGPPIRKGNHEIFRDDTIHGFRAALLVGIEPFAFHLPTLLFGRTADLLRWQQAEERAHEEGGVRFRAFACASG